jgi:hypothetical protein
MVKRRVILQAGREADVEGGDDEELEPSAARTEEMTGGEQRDRR